MFRALHQPQFQRLARPLYSLIRIYCRLLFYIKIHSSLMSTATCCDRFDPPVNRNMTILDRAFFQKSVPLLAVRFSNPKFIADFVKSCKSDVFLRLSIKHIVSIGDSKAVLLRPDASDFSTYKKIIAPETLALIASCEASVEPYTLELDYTFWKCGDILRATLPVELLAEIPSGYAQAGHVAHLNLREEFKPYGELIGNVIIDKNAKIETVVDKVNTIDEKFRTFPMKVLAGKNDLMVEQSESGCKFRFDFGKVYWNLRLTTEHERLIKGFNPADVVGDVFAGVGPFAVPAGKKLVIVLANDLNPESFKHLTENIASNHTEDFVRPFNLDGREFIRESPRILYEWFKNTPYIEVPRVAHRSERGHTKRRKVDATLNTRSNGETALGIMNIAATVAKSRVSPVGGQNTSSVKQSHITRVPVTPFFNHYVMNLPDSAILFLDEFIGLYSRHPMIAQIVRQDPNFSLPLLNVHCFEKYSNEKPEPLLHELHTRIHQRVCRQIDYDIDFDELSIHLVRKVAPNKPMFCVTFRLPQQVAFRNV